MRGIKVFLLVLLACLPPGFAVADVAPEPTSGKEFVIHDLEIENLKDFPGYSILVYDDSSSIGAHRVFNADSESRQQLESGRSWRSSDDFDSPQLWLMPRAGQEAWSKATAEEIDRQHKACDERGEGCAHISRFEPDYAPPEGAIDCGVQISIITERSIDPDASKTVADVFRLVEASDKLCKLELVSSSKTVGTPPPGGGSPWLLVFGVVLVALFGVGVWAVSRLRLSRSTGKQVAT